MNIVYFGTPDFAVKPLEKIIEAGYTVSAVVTNKDKPVGRKQILTPSAVKVCALKHGIKVLEYSSVRREGVEDLKSLNADLFITCAFGQILSKEILNIPKIYTLNIHGSILPEYRGAAPIQRAVIDGKKQTGITIMRTDEGIDTGDIMFSRYVDIGENETAGELFDRLSVLGAECIITALESVKSGSAVFAKQNDELSSYAKMIEKSEGKINFNLSAEQIKNLVRGFNPAPSAYAVIGEEVLKIHSVTLSNGVGKAGEVISVGKTFEVACGKGSVIINDLTKQGGKRMSGDAYLRGSKIKLGDIFD